jgi:hypothetical protein
VNFCDPQSPVDKTFLVRFKSPETSTQEVTAAIAEVVDDYLVMFDASGDLVGVFAMGVIESWSEVIPNSNRPPSRG